MSIHFNRSNKAATTAMARMMPTTMPAILGAFNPSLGGLSWTASLGGIQLDVVQSTDLLDEAVECSDG